MRVIAILLGVVAAHGSSVFDEIQEEEWKAFKLTYKKEYSVEDDGIRKKIFMESRQQVAQHNQLYERGLSSFRLGINQFADMLHSEYLETQNGFGSGRGARAAGGAAFVPPAGVEAAAEVDWRRHGAVTEVKTQGSCGACYAFAATGALEGQVFRHSQRLVSLSEQNIIDCSGGYGNLGCDGGYFEAAFTYVRDNGIVAEDIYPYEEISSSCRFKSKDVSTKDMGFMQIPSGDELALQAAVATVGPVAVAMDASSHSLRLYSDGVFYDAYCKPDNLTHAVLVVGYGADETGGNYWLVKNSWGPSWGIDGYFKIARNRDNHCGIASSGSFPLL